MYIAYWLDRLDHFHLLYSCHALKILMLHHWKAHLWQLRANPAKIDPLIQKMASSFRGNPPETKSGVISAISVIDWWRHPHQISRSDFAHFQSKPAVLSRPIKDNMSRGDVATRSVMSLTQWKHLRAWPMPMSALCPALTCIIRKLCVLNSLRVYYPLICNWMLY